MHFIEEQLNITKHHLFAFPLHCNRTAANTLCFTFHFSTKHSQVFNDEETMRRWQIDIYFCRLICRFLSLFFGSSKKTLTWSPHSVGIFPLPCRFGEEGASNLLVVDSLLTYQLPFIGRNTAFQRCKKYLARRDTDCAIKLFSQLCSYWSCPSCRRKTSADNEEIESPLPVFLPFKCRNVS